MRLLLRLSVLFFVLIISMKASADVIEMVTWKHPTGTFIDRNETPYNKNKILQMQFTLTDGLFLSAQEISVQDRRPLPGVFFEKPPVPRTPLLLPPQNPSILPRLDGYMKTGSDRSLAGFEAFYPLSWNGESLTYTDVRFIADDDNSNEFNLGFGLRHIPRGQTYMLGAYGFVARRNSPFDNLFSQATLGAEFLTENRDFRINFYQPLNGAKILDSTNSTQTGFSGNSLTVDSLINATLETPMQGFDIESGVKLPFPANTRLFGTLYHFNADQVDSMTGFRIRARMRPRNWLQFSLGHQHDDVRGETNFAEIRLRLLFGNGGASRKQNPPTGIYARLDEEITREIDIVTRKAVQVTSSQQNIAVIDDNTAAPAFIRHVDNTVAAGGDGSAENPHNTLSDAQTAAGPNEILYVHAGDGTVTGQDTGITLDETGQKLLGSGASLTFAETSLSAPGFDHDETVFHYSGMPTITNTGGTAITVTADNVTVAGLRVDKPTGHGVGITNANNVVVRDMLLTEVGDLGGENAIDVVYSAAGNWAATLDQNTISNSYQDGISILAQNNAIADITATENTVLHSGRNGVNLQGENDSTLTGTFTSNTFSENSGDGAYLLSRNNSVVTSAFTGNALSNNSTNGVYVTSQDDSVMTSTITNNTLSGNTGYNGIYLYGQQNSVMSSTITNNTISDNALEGLLFRSSNSSTMTVSAVNNILSRNGDTGIYLWAENNGVLNSTFTGNTLLGNYTGFYVFNRHDGAINLTLVDNSILDTDTIGLGIFTRNNATVTGTFVGNTFSGSGLQGIFARSSNDSAILNTFTNNTILNNGLQGIHMQSRNASTASATLTGNLISDNRDGGVFLDSQDDSDFSGFLEGNTIVGNRDNNSYGVRIDDESTQIMNIDLGGGGLGSTGNNRIYDNRLQEVYVDLDGLELKAENNWWGTATGLAPEEIRLEEGSTLDADPWLMNDPAP